jgi:hypothetical protein
MKLNKSLARSQNSLECRSRAERSGYEWNKKIINLRHEMTLTARNYIKRSQRKRKPSERGEESKQTDKEKKNFFRSNNNQHVSRSIKYSKQKTCEVASSANIWSLSMPKNTPAKKEPKQHVGERENCSTKNVHFSTQ